jgi:hypothetical protein
MLSTPTGTAPRLPEQLRPAAVVFTRILASVAPNNGIDFIDELLTRAIQSSTTAEHVHPPISAVKQHPYPRLS